MLLQANAVFERMQEKILSDEITQLFKEKDFIELNERWLLINHRETARRILQCYGNDVKRNILTMVAETPMTISEIIEKTDSPTSTVYREVDELISNGLLFRSGYSKSSKKTAIKLIALIQNMKVEIDRNHISVLVKTNTAYNDVFRTWDWS